MPPRSSLHAPSLSLPRKRGGAWTEHAASLSFSTNEHVLFLRSRFRSLIDRCEAERLERWLVGFLVEELPQAGIVGIFLVRHFDRLAFLGVIIVGLRDIHGSHVPNGLLGGAQHGGA